jgi:hypothetical protein
VVARRVRDPVQALGTRTPEEREAARQEAREKTRKQRAELPFVEKKISVPDEDRICEACGGTDLHALGEGEVSEQIDFIPARTVRIRWVREKLACASGNNVSERALRIVASLRKNALFVGQDLGGQNLAILLTIVSTRVLHGVEPRRYLADVIVRVNVPGNTLDELLPWNWKPAAA